MTTRRRSLTDDMDFLFGVAMLAENGQLELSRFTAETKQHRKVERVRAMLHHEGDGVDLMGVGRTATEAVHELREAVERAQSMAASR